MPCNQATAGAPKRPAMGSFWRMNAKPSAAPMPPIAILPTVYVNEALEVGDVLGGVEEHRPCCADAG